MSRFPGHALPTCAPLYAPVDVACLMCSGTDGVAPIPGSADPDFPQPVRERGGGGGEVLRLPKLLGISSGWNGVVNARQAYIQVR